MSKKMMSNNMNKFNGDSSVDQASSRIQMQKQALHNSDIKIMNSNMLNKKSSECLRDGSNNLRGKNCEEEIYQSMPNFNLRHPNYNVSAANLFDDSNMKMQHL